MKFQKSKLNFFNRCIGQTNGWTSPKEYAPSNFFKVKRWFHELTLVCVMYLGLGFRLSVSVSLLDQDASHHEICTGTLARWFPWHPLKENFHLGLAKTVILSISKNLQQTTLTALTLCKLGNYS